MTEISLSQMDYDRFGVVTAKCFARTVQDVVDIEVWCESRGVEFVIARIDTINLQVAQQLEAHGHRLMDTLVYFRRTFGTEDLPPVALPDYYFVSDDARPQAAEMAHVAALSFKSFIGHYHSDTRLDSHAADAAYVSWAERSAASEDVAHHIVSIWREKMEGQAELVAFATLNDAGRECEGVLFGVHPDHQGKGLHRSLVRAALLNASRRGCSSFSSSTQLTNYQVQRNWAREGLLPSHSFYTFHQWRI